MYVNNQPQKKNITSKLRSLDFSFFMLQYIWYCFKASQIKGIGSERLKKLLKILAVLAVIIILLFGGMYMYLSNNLNKLVDAEVREIEIENLKTGTYIGEYSVPPVSATVEVTISDGRIETIKLLDHGNGMGQPAEIIVDIIVSEQSLAVDSISGATYSSRVIVKAVEDALIKAE